MAKRSQAAVFDLTADVVARAVIAAARSYGVDPLQILEPRASGRRAVVAAASVLQAEGMAAMPALERMLGVRSTTVHHARRAARRSFVRATLAAGRAVQYARWRPEAAVSVVVAAPVAPVARETAAERPEPTTRMPPRLHGAGFLSAMTRPTYSPPPGPPPERSLGDRILDELAGGAISAMGLATRLDVKELTVSQTVRAMFQAGLLVGGEIPFEGRRFQKWGLA